MDLVTGGAGGSLEICWNLPIFIDRCRYEKHPFQDEGPPKLMRRPLSSILLFLFLLFAAVNNDYGQCSMSGAPSIRSSTGYWAICGNNALLLTSSSSTGNTWLLDGQAFDSSSASIGVTQPGNY